MATENNWKSFFLQRIKKLNELDVNSRWMNDKKNKTTKKMTYVPDAKTSISLRYFIRCKCSWRMPFVYHRRWIQLSPVDNCACACIPRIEPARWLVQAMAWICPRKRISWLYCSWYNSCKLPLVIDFRWESASFVTTFTYKWERFSHMHNARHHNNTTQHCVQRFFYISPFPVAKHRCDDDDSDEQNEISFSSPNQGLHELSRRIAFALIVVVGFFRRLFAHRHPQPLSIAPTLCIPFLCLY